MSPALSPTSSAEGEESASPPRLRGRVVMLYSRTFLPSEGWYRRVYNQAQALLCGRAQVTLLAWDRECRSPEQEDVDGIDVRRFRIPAGVAQGPRNIVNHWRFHRACRRWLAGEEFDVLHCFNVDTMAPGLWAARGRRKRAVLDLCEPEYYRGFWKSRYAWLLAGVNWVERTCARRFDHLFVHNGYQVRKFQACGVSRMTRVGSYPDAALLAADPKPASDEVVIGRIGSAYPNNGYEELVAAFQQLLARQAGRGSRSFVLRIAGHVFPGYREAFERLTAPLGANLRLSGAFDVKDLASLYRELDLSVQLYGEEFRNVTPTKLFESLACGVPVVANAVGDMAEILAEGNCGLIVDARDPVSICEAIERLATDDELRQGMAERGRELVRCKYTWEAARPDFLRAYAALLP